MDDTEFIYSWFINPHTIWIKRSKASVQLVLFEHELDQYYRNSKNARHDAAYKPKVGDMIVYFDRSCSKWYRAIVDFTIELSNNTESYIIWLIDYGFPVRTAGAHIYRLEKRFYTPETFGNVFKVGVANVLPASEDYDYLHERPVVHIDAHWNKSTVAQLQKIFESSSGIEFQEKTRLKEHLFGDLYIHTNTGKILDLGKVLAKSANAIQVDGQHEFIQKLVHLETVNIERYQDNNRQCSKSPEQPKRSPNGMFAHAKKESRCEETVSSSSQYSIVTSCANGGSKMPHLINSLQDKEERVSGTISNTSGSSSYESEPKGPPSISSKKLTTILDRLSQPPKILKNAETKKKKQAKPEQSHKKRLPHVPACYDQILSQEARANKIKSPPKSTSSQSSKGSSRLDKLLALRKSPRTKNDTLSSTDGYKSSNESTASTTSCENIESRITKVQQATVAQLDSQDLFMCRQGVKYRDVEENNRPFVDTPLVLVHGKHPTHPVHSYRDVPFTPEVIDAMKKRNPRNEIRRLQAHVWPHIMHENSAVIVGNPRSGKTSALMPAICSLVIRLYEDEQLPETSGPAVIIVSAFADSVSDIQRSVRYHLYNWNQGQEKDKQILIEESYGRHREDEIEANLLNGVGVLVVTPPCLQRMIHRTTEQGIPLLKKPRVKILVIEDFDTIYNHYGEMICDEIQYFYVKHSDGNPTQLLITSSQWETQLLKYCHYGKSPILYMANYIEACVYGKAKFRLSFSKKEKKLNLVKDFLADDIYKAKRSLIICSNDDEVYEVCHYLVDLNIILTSYTHDTDEAGRDQVLSWHEDTHRHFSVLVCSDTVLGDLSKLKNVQRLFHYSLPDLWSTFSFRFSVFFDTYHDYLRTAEAPTGYEPPSTQIVIDEFNKSTLPRLTEFLQRVKAKVPKEVEVVNRQILIEREAERKSVDLCPFFLHYGIEAMKCPRSNCRGRHALLPCDKPTKRMPPFGVFLKIKITCIHSPIHYSGQIICYRYHNECVWHQYQERDQNAADVELQMQLNIYFNNFDNQRRLSGIKKGDLAGFVEPGSIWRRVQVIEVPSNIPSGDRPLKVSIRLIDTGVIYYDQSATSLFQLPDTLRKIPPRAIDIHHIGIVPYDGDKCWGARTKQCVKQQIERFLERKRREEEKSGKNYYIKASVALRIENNIWTKTLVMCEPSAGDHIQELALHKVLLRNNLAQRDTELKQLDVLKRMAEELGFFQRSESNENLVEGFCTSNAFIEASVTHSNLSNVKPIARSTWDSLETSLLHPIVVYHIETPSEFTFVRVDRVQKIDELHELINQFMATPENVQPIESPEIGDNCLVPLDDDYVRGRIINVGEDDEGKFVSVFSCDFGQIEKYDLGDVFMTSTKIVEFMAYTAIMGAFSGIVFYDGEDTRDKMWDLIQESLKHGEIYAKMIEVKESLSWLPGISYYDLVLTFRDKDDNITILNQEFVKRGYAKWDENSGAKVQKLTPNSFLKDLLRAHEPAEENLEENWDELVGTHKKTEVTPITSEEHLESDMESLAKLSNQLFGAEEREIDLDDEDMIQMMKMFKLETYIPIYRASKAQQDLKRSAPKQLKAIKGAESSQTSCKEEVINSPDLLIHTTHQSEVVWQQNPFMVVISIHLGDNHDYHLKITKSTMIFAHFIPNDEPQLRIINFFGLINTKLVSHQIRGLNLVIRVPKRFVGLLWPYLNKEGDKGSNVKYNLDSLRALDDDFELFDPSQNKTIRPEEYYTSDDDDSLDEVEEDEEEHDDLEDPLFDGII